MAATYAAQNSQASLAASARSGVASITDEALLPYVVPGSYTIQQVKEMKEAFEYLDEDQSGKVDVDEFVSAVRALNINVTNGPNDLTTPEVAIKAALGSTEMDFEEFMNRMTAKLNPEDSADDILNIFEMFDKDRNGTISKEELMAIAVQCETGDKIWSEADIDGILRNMVCVDTPPGKEREIDPIDFYMALMRGVESRDEHEKQIKQSMDKLNTSMTSIGGVQVNR